MSTLVRDVTEAEFDQIVVEGSKVRPVVVDFWAAWCGPCRQLSPLLERAAARWQGEIDVVKVDVDANPRISQTFRVQGIPAVKAFADGRMVNEFTGLQPAPMIEQFFAGLAPSEADRLVVRAAGTPDDDAATRLLTTALEQERDHPGAALALAAIHEAAGDIDSAVAVLAVARPTAEVQQATARLRLASAANGSAAAGGLDALRARVEGGDDDARLELGTALAATDAHEEAIAVLLDAVRTPATKDAGRDALLEVFTVLGNDDPLVKAARPKLAAALF